jgi:hypothetical protein
MRTVAAIAVLAVLGGAGSSAAAQTPTRLIVSLQLANTARNSFQNTLLYNCNLFFSGGLAVEGRRQYAAVGGPPRGVLDFAQGRGQAFVRRTRWQVEPLPPIRARPTLFADLGVSLQGANVFLTARVTRGRPLISARRRARLGVVRAAGRLDGPLLDGHGKPVPNTFTYIAEGKLKMLPAMSRALERTRCKNRRQNRASRPFKPGYELGKLTVGLRPNHASGLAGEARFRPLVFARGPEDDEVVAIEPGAGVRQGTKRNLFAPITSGLPVPLTCETGDLCTPSGGTLGLGGGFDLVFGGRRTSVGNITVSITGTAPDFLQWSVAGTLDGAPVTITTGGGLTDDFTQRAGAALGAEIVGDLNLELLFTRTGP